MKKADLHFIDETSNGYSDIMQFLFRSSWELNADEYNRFVKSLIRKSADTADFVARFLDKQTATDHEYYKSDIYQIMLRKYDSRAAWYYCRENLGDRCRKTWSNAGALKIGNESFKAYFPNYYGDGETRYAVLNRDEFYASQIFKYETMFFGENINIYSYDCGEEIAETLPRGRYSVYAYEGMIAIVKNDEEV